MKYSPHKVRKEIQLFQKQLPETRYVADHYVLEESIDQGAHGVVGVPGELIVVTNSPEIGAIPSVHNLGSVL